MPTLQSLYAHMIARPSAVGISLPWAGYYHLTTIEQDIIILQPSSRILSSYNHRAGYYRLTTFEQDIIILQPSHRDVRIIVIIFNSIKNIHTNNNLRACKKNTTILAGGVKNICHMPWLVCVKTEQSDRSIVKLKRWSPDRQRCTPPASSHPTVPDESSHWQTLLGPPGHQQDQDPGHQQDQDHGHQQDRGGLW